MITGYTRPLYLLPFDHRASYISGLFGWQEPLNTEQMITVAQSKQVIYAGFQQAIADQVPQDRVGILVDEEFGSAILRDAGSLGYITVAPCNGYLEYPFKNSEFHSGFVSLLAEDKMSSSPQLYSSHQTFAKNVMLSSPQPYFA